MTTASLLLVWNDGAPAFQVIEPIDGVWLLGRNHPAWDPADGRMSRQHIEVTLVDGRWQFHDLGSVNGSFLDGAAVVGREFRDDWRFMHVGRSLLIPVRLPLQRPAVCHLDAFAGADARAVKDAASSVAPAGEWRAEIAWWIHHALRDGPEIDASFVAACLRDTWPDRGALLGAVAISRAALHAGARRITGADFLSFRGAANWQADRAHAVIVELAPGYSRQSSHLEHLRDPAFVARALAESGGDHQRAAGLLRISVEALAEWLRRHGMSDAD